MRRYSIIAILLMMALAFGCASSASPTPPADIPTTVEYAEGDIIVSASIQGFGSSESISVNGRKDTCTPPDGIFMIDANGVPWPYEVEIDGTLYWTVPDGKFYAFTFYSGDTLIATMEFPEMSTDAFPGICFDGQESSGEYEIGSDDTTVIAFGSLLVCAEDSTDSISKISPAESIEGYMNSCNVDLVEEFGWQIGMFTRLDIDLSGTFDYLEPVINFPDGWDDFENILAGLLPDYVLQRLLNRWYDLEIAYGVKSMQSISDLGTSGDYADVSTMYYDGYVFYFSSNRSMYDDADILYLSSNVDIEKDSGLLIAGQFEESCYTDPINFFCNFDADGIPSDATYYLRLDKNSDEVPLTIVSQFAMPSTLTETELMTAAFPRPMLTVNGSDEVTKLEWQWYRRGGVTTMSDSEVLESIDIWVGSDGTQLIRSGLEIEYGDENTEVEWTWTDGSTKNGDGFVIEGNISSGSIDIPNIPINQINSLDFYYYDPIGNNRRFEWSGNPESE